ncbi:MAG: nucleotidyltransferase family protein [Myxococcaceae bacterium]
MALLSLLRVLPPKNETGAHILANASAPTLATEARRHGLSAVLQDALERSGVTWRSEHQDALRRDSFAVIANGLRVRALLFSTLDVLAKVDVFPVLLKGYGFGLRYYPDPLFRPTFDVDLLIGENDWVRADRALQELGLRPPERAAVLYHRQHHHHVHYGGAPGSVELHFRPFTGLGGALNASGYLERAREGRIEGRAVRYLSPTDECRYLALHAAGHLFARLSWLYDLKLLLAQTPVDWDAMAHESQRDGLARATGIAFHVLERALDVRTEANRFRTSKTSPAWVDRAFSDERLEKSAWANSKWPAFGLTLLLSDGMTNRFLHLGHHGLRGLRRRASRTFPSLVPEIWRG